MINKENILFLINRLGKFFNFKRGKNKEELINLINEVENDIIEKNNKIEYLMNDNNIWKVNYKSLETEKNNTIGILEKKNMFVSSILNSNKLLNPILAEFDTIVEEDYQKFANSVRLKEEVEAFVKYLVTK